MDSELFRFLGRCARAECSPAHYDAIAKAAAGFAGWEQLPGEAEKQGMAPLLYWHLKQAGVSMPNETKRQLQALYLRHRRSGLLRMQVLTEILQLFQVHEIEAIVLKGAALSHLIYAEPGLRPMSDLDILVRPADALQAQALLAEVGFPEMRSPERPWLHKHLALITVQIEGLPIQVEIHYKLHSDYIDNLIAFLRSRWLGADAAAGQNSAALDGLFDRSRPFALHSLTARALGHEDMLQHLCQHMLAHVNVWDYCRLIWMADLVSYAERFAAEIDWTHIGREAPAVIRTLSLLHFITPLSDELMERAGVQLGKSPRGMGVDFAGWPRVRPGREQRSGLRALLRETLSPSEWWLRLRYRLGSTRPLLMARWVQHPLHIVGQMMRAMLESLGWPRAFELAGQVAAVENEIGEPHEA